MIINNIEYKEVPGYQGYYAGYDGTIYSSKSNKIRKFTANNKGYLMVSLQDAEHIQHACQVHRLIALSWISNPDNKPEVHHIDEDKTNNSVTNLTWVTRIENINAGTRTKRVADKQKNDKNQSKPVVLTNITDGSKLYFPSIKEAKRNGYRADHVLSGKNKTTKGYFVEYNGSIC